MTNRRKDDKMTERRKDDDRINELLGIVTELNVLVKQVHVSWFGNGKDGYKSYIDKMIGGLSVWKFIAGGGGIIAIGLLIVEIIKFVR